MVDTNCNKISGIILICFVSYVAGKPVDVETLDGAGVFNENIGVATIYQNEWIIAGSIEMPNWENTLKSIRDSKIEIRDICTKVLNTPQSTVCTHWYHRIENRIRDAEDRLSHIQFFSNAGSKKQKRGMVDFVGHATKFLFGTMDSSDEEEIKSKLAELQNQKGNNWNFLEKQMTVMYDNFDMITKPIESLKETQLNISKTLNLVIQSTNEASHNRMIQEKINLLNQDVESVLDNLDNIIKSLNRFISIFNSLITHKLPIELLEATTLEKVYLELAQERNINQKFMKKEVIFELATLKWTQTENILSYKAGIPIDMSELFQIFKLVPYPIENDNNTYSIPVLEEDMFMISGHRQLIPDKGEIESRCTKLKFFDLQNLRLCKNFRREPTIRSENTEIAINVVNYINIPSLPQIRTRLTNPNSYLFCNSEPQTMQSLCDKKTYQTPMGNLGVFTLNGNCFHYLNGELIPTRKQYVSKIPKEKVKIQLNEINHNFENITDTNTILQPLKFNSSEDFKDHFKKISNNFEILAKEEKRLKEENNQTMINYGNLSFSGFTTVLIIAAVVYLIMRSKKITINNVEVERPTVSAPINPRPINEVIAGCSGAHPKQKTQAN